MSEIIQGSVTLNEGLSQISLIFVYAAMALYTIAFLLFAGHFAGRASADPEATAKKINFERVAVGLMIVAAISHGIGVVLRGISASRVPWANMYEFSISGSFVIVAIFILALFFVTEIRVIAVMVTGFALLTLGAATTLFYVQVKTLMPALQSYWLVIHVTVAVFATAFFNIAAALSVAYLFKTSPWFAGRKGWLIAAIKRILAVFPKEKRLEKLSYRFNIIGFILWTFTLIAGAIWAERAWHRYWGWDTKEVWTFIIWTIYAGYLHANATRGWTGRRSAWLALVGFAAVIFNFTIVNLFFKGLHVYSGLK
ncbi:MAG: c-type cytochrome biogenesis protein CcsB [Micrococcales bacterium]